MSSDAPTEVNDPDFQIDLVVDDGGTVYLFHNKPFTTDVGWLEFHALARELWIVLENGEQRFFGAAIPPHLADPIGRASDVSMVLMDAAGKPVAGASFPLVVHDG